MNNKKEKLGISISMEKTLKVGKKEKNTSYPISHTDIEYLNKCPLCSSSNIVIISDVTLNGKLTFFQTAICSKCFHGFRSVQPAFSWFRERWKQISSPDNNKVFNLELEDSRRVRYTQYYDIVKKYKSSGRMLDIGAGYGTGSNVFLKHGYDVEAIEVEDDRVSYIRNTYNVKVYSETIDKIDSPEELYDLIIFSHCLEHMDDPIMSLHHLHKLLSNDGFVYLEIPIIWNIVDWKDSFFMAHKSNFNERGIVKILQLTGFNIVEKFVVTCVDTKVDNIGFLLIKDSNNIPILDNGALDTPLLDPDLMLVSDVKRLYSRGNSELDLDGSSPIRYSVPYIDNFFHIVRSDNGSFFDGRDDSGFFEFIPY